MRPIIVPSPEKALKMRPKIVPVQKRLKKSTLVDVQTPVPFRFLLCAEVMIP